MSSCFLEGEIRVLGEGGEEEYAVRATTRTCRLPKYYSKEVKASYLQS